MTLHSMITAILLVIAYLCIHVQGTEDDEHEQKSLIRLYYTHPLSSDPSAAHVIDVDADGTIQELHDAISAEMRCNACEYQITYQGRVLKPSELIADSGLCSETLVQVVAIPLITLPIVIPSDWYGSVPWISIVERANEDTLRLPVDTVLDEWIDALRITKVEKKSHLGTTALYLRSVYDSFVDVTAQCTIKPVEELMHASGHHLEDVFGWRWVEKHTFSQEHSRTIFLMPRSESESVRVTAGGNRYLYRLPPGYGVQVIFESPQAAAAASSGPSRPRDELSVNDFDAVAIERHDVASGCASFLQGHATPFAGEHSSVDCNASSISVLTAIWMIEYLDDDASLQYQASPTTDRSFVYVKLRNRALMEMGRAIDHLRFLNDKKTVDLNGDGGSWTHFRLEYCPQTNRWGEQSDAFELYSPKWNTYLGVVANSRENYHMVQVAPDRGQEYERIQRLRFNLVGSKKEEVLERMRRSRRH